jgi:hypothetical protein
MSDERSDALTDRLAKEDQHAVDLIDRMDAFLIDMQAISDRLLAKLEAQEAKYDHP